MYVDEYLRLSDPNSAPKPKRDAGLATIAGGGAIKGLTTMVSVAT